MSDAPEVPEDDPVAAAQAQVKLLAAKLKAERAKTRKKKSRGESATSPRRLKAVLEKQAQALEYRKMAYSYSQIAEALGYAGPQGAQAAVEAAINRVIREPAQAVLTLELERLDGMFSKPYQNAINGDLMAVSACLSIMARKARLLGLDAPVKTDATVSNGPAGAFRTMAVTDAQVQQAVAKAAESF